MIYIVVQTCESPEWRSCWWQWHRTFVERRAKIRYRLFSQHKPSLRAHVSWLAAAFLWYLLKFADVFHDVETLRALHQQVALCSKRRAWFTAVGKIRWKSPRPLRPAIHHSSMMDQYRTKTCFPIFNQTVRRSTFTSSSRWTSTTFRKFNLTKRAPVGGFMGQWRW